MNPEILRVVRNILLRAFAIGVTIMILLAIITFSGWETWMSIFTEKWHLISRDALSVIVVSFFTEARFFLLLCLLTPALAIHWTLKREASLHIK